MIILINGGGDLGRLGAGHRFGRLVSPRSGNKVKPGERWAADNDAFKAWDADRFVAMLNRVESHRASCLFVACPDVVADHRATLDRFWDWLPEIRGRGLPVAFVGQDGAESGHVPWDCFDALFLGGSTDWKLSAAAGDLAIEARRLGKWTHMGRVNSRKRIMHAAMDGIDSIDGGSFSMFPDLYMRKGIKWLSEVEARPFLPFSG